MTIVAEAKDGSIDVADTGSIEVRDGDLNVDLTARGANNTVDFALGSGNVNVCQESTCPFAH